MGAPIIGRTACPECGFANAHVKKSERCTFRYCPECGAQHHARTERQVADLLSKMRPADAAPAKPEPTKEPVAEREPVDKTPPTPTPKPAAGRRGLFNFD